MLWFSLTTLTALAAILPGALSTSFLRRSGTGQPVAQVKNGTLVGIYNAKYKQDFFLGVPFAQPPVGQLRLSNPVPLDTKFKTKQATKYYPNCVGYGSDDWSYELSEDCLALNVVRPAGYSLESKLPVVVWVYGGGYIQGGSNDQRYNLSFIIQDSMQMGKPIIGISINCKPPLGKTTDHHTNILSRPCRPVGVPRRKRGSESGYHQPRPQRPTSRTQLAPRKRRRIWWRPRKSHDLGRERWRRQRCIPDTRIWWP